MYNKILLKTLIKVDSSRLNASFGTFYVEIGQLFVAQWDFKISDEFEIDVIFLQKQRFDRFSNIFQRLTVTPKIDQFGRKSCQKKRKDMSYQLL